MRSVDDMYELSDDVDMEKNYLRSQQKMTLNNALKKISMDYSQVLRLTYLEGFSNSDAAKITDTIAVST